jgi:hypothetical protein
MSVQEVADLSGLDESRDANVTSALSPAERQRRHRVREQALLFERDDWRLFIDPATLPEKAGCQPGDLRRLCASRAG